MNPGADVPAGPGPRSSPPVWLLLALIVMAALHLFAPVRTIVPWPWTLLGLAPLAGGIALASWGSLLFDRRGTTVKPHLTPTALVTDGPYRWSRNPMYLGTIVALLGVALLMGTLTPPLVVPIFAGFLTGAFIVPEERRLAEHFGDEFVQYRRRVRRWI